MTTITPPKIIAAVCVWNEEQFIRSCIESIMARIKDIYAIEIMDGAWLPYSDYYPLSTDNTKQIILELKQKYQHLCKIILREPVMVFESESQKRNRQLETIETQYQDYVVFVIDGDEQIQPTTGLQQFELASYADNIEAIGCVKAYSIGSNKKMWTPRLFKGHRKIHYHTNHTMEVHGLECVIKVPYDLKSQDKLEKPVFGTYKIDDFVLVNHYIHRDLPRLEQKLESAKHEKALQLQPCGY